MTLLHEDANAVIERFYSKEDVLLYVDPPYFGHEKEYRESVDYNKTMHLLFTAKCKVCISEYPEAISRFPGWRIVPKTTAGRARTGAHNQEAKKNTECLLMNY